MKTYPPKNKTYALKSVYFIAFLLLYLMVLACTNAVRMQAKFDDEPLNSIPNEHPNPTPPADLFNWGQIDITARIVPGNSGGNEVRIAPSTNYISTGKYRAFVLNAFSDGITTTKKPGIRGSVTVTMLGTGKMVISIRNAQGSNLSGDPLGGYLFVNNGIPSIGYMTSQNLKTMQINPMILNSTMLCSYVSGQPVVLQWSIDQDSHVISIGATPSSGFAKNETVQFNTVTQDGTPNTPIQKIWLSIEMFEITQSTSAFFDDFLVEEF